MNKQTSFPWQETDLATLTALAEKKYKLEYTQVGIGENPLHIAQIANMKELLDASIQKNALANALHTLPLWAKVWPASVVLGHSLLQLPNKHMPLLEIGAGTGVAGLLAAAGGFENVIISDVNEDALLFAQINVVKNNLQDKVRVEKIDIATSSLSARYPLIIGAEILYLSELYAPLVQFLHKHIAQDESGAFILFAGDDRRPAKEFFSLASSHFTCLHKQVGLREKSSANKQEKHKIMLHKLTPMVHNS